MTETVGTLTQDLGRAPTVGEIAETGAVRRGDLLEALEADRNYRAGSLDSALTDDGDQGSLWSQSADDDEAFSDVERQAALAVPEQTVR
jgi:RNA polymerase sigma-B factor